MLYLAEILYEVYETPPTGDEAEDRPIAPVPKVPLIAVFHNFVSSVLPLQCDITSVSVGYVLSVDHLV